MRSKGFTIAELLVVMAVVAITAVLAAPMLTSLIESTRLTSAANAMVESVAQARSEAVKRGFTIEVVPLGANWQSGWKVKEINVVMQCPVDIPDCEDDEKEAVDKGNTVRVVEDLPPALSIGIDDDDATLQFSPTGRRVVGAEVAITICGNSKKGRVVTITPAGSTQVEHLESGCSI
ncbi:GspH/FimT family pseudopilin [Permianibacter aggregans]|uniref:Type II secretion system protein H n=1 Tax=Permianibacter aggregans TaxID=1510150 RepID=A0A4R6UVR3_9GAMM|nr:GspH/FimT family pseudopilin [Permianibacter aggregans]QGX38574.1 prepilin-type N-terminal cleavage/methylation domain-containing protein [Permianibacter aggregans]TDQ50356.1 type IV fimbrial biogenesis protein FimT [Permianibacter aggregans]